MVGLGYIGSLIKRVVAPPPPQYVNYSLGVGVCCSCIMRIFHYFQQIPKCAVPQSDLVRRRRSLSYSLSPACYVQTRWFGNNTFTYIVVIILLVNALQSTICNWHCIFYLPLLSIRTFIHKIFMSVSTNVLYHLATKPNPIILTTILCESSIPPCSLQRSVAQQFSGVQDNSPTRIPKGLIKVSDWDCPQSTCPAIFYCERRR